MLLSCLFLVLAFPLPLPQKVGPVPEKLRQEWRLATFYQKHLAVRGFPIVSSAQVSDAALQEAAHIVRQMLAQREDVLQALVRHKVRLAVMAPTEMTTDIPEHRDLTPKDYWDRRARGLGATRSRPAVSCGEENLLHLRGDRYPRENILVHEFGHTIHELGLNSLDPRFDARLRDCYAQAMQKGLWQGTYAATNHQEYWAEGVQSYFDCNNPPDRQHNDINTREKLAQYDPALFALLDEAFRQNPWRYVRYDKRPKK
jgi:alpha-glucosidase